jgi:hypothetical protein
MSPGPNEDAREAAEQGGRPDDAWVTIERRLIERRRAIARQIRTYPPPIAGCDQQFNKLLEDREAMSREIERLAQLRAGPGDAAIALDTFVASSKWLDGADMQAIRQETMIAPAVP